VATNNHQPPQNRDGGVREAVGGGTVGRVSDDALFGPEVGTVAPGTWSVPELSAHLGRLLANALPGDVWVSGQIRNLNRSANGHVYFHLTDPVAAGDAPQAQLAVTLLAPERQLVNDQIRKAGGAVRMADGIEVRVQGRVRWYSPRGTVQLRMYAIDPTFTLGRLEADRERLLAVLAAEDLLERNRRLPMPQLPLRLGLVTSRGSAAHADVLHELEASGIGFSVHAVDARTQGPECGPSVARALGHLKSVGVDLVLVVRGGGARTDLAGFDTEIIARAIATMEVPVFTGIGHEVDRSIADEVAHQAHKTPTAAAAAAVSIVRAYQHELDRRSAAIARAVRRSLDVAEARLDDRARRVRRGAPRGLTRTEVQLDEVAGRAARGAGRSLAAADARVEAAGPVLAGRAGRVLDRAEQQLAHLAHRVTAHDPQRLLDRGWTITTTAEGRLLRTPADAPAGTHLTTRLRSGTIDSVVTDPEAETRP
jgi:exodeoxyribonuclease VII large subunit